MSCKGCAELRIRQGGLFGEAPKYSTPMKPEERSHVLSFGF